MKKYELTENKKMFCGVELYQIRALTSFADVKGGELDGWIEKEENLSHEGDAKVYGDAKVCGDALVYGNAWVSGDAKVCGYAKVRGNAEVYGNAVVRGNAWVYGNAEVCGDAVVCGDAKVRGDAEVCGNALIQSNKDYATIKGLGSIQRTTTFFRLKDGGIGVCCGCFYGTLDEFRAQVVKTHGSTKYAQEYLEIADFMERHFETEDEK